MNRLDEVFKKKRERILSIYFTAGFPQLNDTVEILQQLQSSGVDFVEVGFPFSDPLADGPVIQQSSQQALQNGMTLSLVLKQLHDVKNSIDIPIVLMGYLNPVLQMGVDKFLEESARANVSGVILPDVPLDMWEEDWGNKFRTKNIHPILLITPQTNDERALRIDSASSGFVYLVASSGITGRQHGESDAAAQYFARIKNLGLKNPLMAGFGIHDRQTFNAVCERASGAIIGSAFIKYLEEHGTNDIHSFIQSVR
ncbi:MAG: tryptophan synthase subunit alpha [Flavobacteriales bacterium]|nr:tryptophan synthase subunit alpha [Flavobacteriales bacterium]